MDSQEKPQEKVQSERDSSFAAFREGLRESARRILDRTKSKAEERWNRMSTKIGGTAALRDRLLQIGRSSQLSEQSRQKIQDLIKRGCAGSKNSSQQAYNELALWTNALLASDFRENIEKWLNFNEGKGSRWDQVLDQKYNHDHIGGGLLHRLFDGNHTLAGAWNAINEKYPMDDFHEKVYGCVSALSKDFSSPMGLPLFTWNREHYQAVASFFKDELGIPKEWFADLQHVNASEAIGSSISVIALALNWNKGQVREFGYLAASAGISGMASANPALAILALAILAKSYTECKGATDYFKIVEGMTKGGIGTGIFLTTSAVIGGPAWIGILAGMCIGVVVNRSLKTVDLSDVAQFIDSSMKKATGTLNPGQI